MDKCEQRGRLAQLVRAPALQAGGRRFEPCTAHHPFAVFPRGDVVQWVRTLPCHGRGREFESRRPRHIFDHLRRCESASRTETNKCTETIEHPRTGCRSLKDSINCGWRSTTWWESARRAGCYRGRRVLACSRTK